MTEATYYVVDFSSGKMLYVGNPFVIISVFDDSSLELTYRISGTSRGYYKIPDACSTCSSVSRQT